MATLHADNIGETVVAANGGTGTLTLSGTAITAQDCRTFSASVTAATAGDITDGGDTEVTIREVAADGTYNGVFENCKSVFTVAGNTITRGTLLSSSTGARVNFSTTLLKHVFVGISGNFANGLMVKSDAETIAGVKTFADGSVKLSGATSGASTLKAPAVASTYVHTLPAATDTLVGRATTDTLTNKRITERFSTTADTATLTPASDDVDMAEVTALTQAMTIANPTGTPTNGQPLLIKYKSAAAQTLSHGTNYLASDIALPIITVAGKWGYEAHIYSTTDSKWHLIGTRTMA